MHALQRSGNTGLLGAHGGAGAEAARVHHRTGGHVPAEGRRDGRDALRRSGGRRHPEAQHPVAEAGRNAAAEEPGPGHRRYVIF